MNKVILMGRLTRDPEMRYTSGDNQMAIARYTLAVDRRFKRAGEDGQTADFINCTVFGKGAEFAENYLHKGTKIAVTGRIQTGSYTNKEGNKVYTTDVIVEEQEFAESKNAAAQNAGGASYSQAPVAPSAANTAARPEPSEAAGDGFMNIPEGIEEDLPFS
ncbi:MAG: single-stranded DNA-binding protein [Lachnospiraceae bacterium]|nr:single-stranded DNA-binding protein [Lachnospiraceae bacterium]